MEGLSWEKGWTWTEIRGLEKRTDRRGLNRNALEPTEESNAYCVGDFGKAILWGYESTWRNRIPRETKLSYFLLGVSPSSIYTKTTPPISFGIGSS